jgi:hypothetical protein
MSSAQTEFEAVISQFNYDPDLPINDNVKNLGHAYKIRRGLIYQIPDDVSSKVVTKGGFKFRSLDEPIAGELVLKQLLARNETITSEEQRGFLTAVSSELFAVQPEAFEDYSDAHSRLMSGQLGERACKYPEVVVKATELARKCREWATQVAEESAIMQDLLACYFLTKRSAKGEIEFGFEHETEGNYVNIYSLGEKEYREILEFMALELGLKAEVDEDEKISDEDVLEQEQEVQSKS